MGCITIVTTRHEFLAQLHAYLQPQFYLETGVQYGTSLSLAKHSKLAIGIDPSPLCNARGNQKIYSVTADDFFQYFYPDILDQKIDLAFIDGSHLFEDALRDFINIEHFSHEKTVVVFDDVLPYNQEIATRDIPPGDWTGDVWKLFPILTSQRPNLEVHLVDTAPTGSMVVWNLDPRDDILPLSYPRFLDEYLETEQVPVEMIERKSAISPEMVLSLLKESRT